MAGNKARKGGKKGRKHGRNTRKPGSAYQYQRTYANKLRRVNRERKKAGKEPVHSLPGYDGLGKPTRG